MKLTVDVSGRASGKTHKILEWMKENPGSRKMICHSRDEAERLYKSCAGTIPKNCFITISSALDGSLRGSTGHFAIDNLDLALHRIFGQPIEYVSMTGIPVSGLSHYER